MHVVILHCHFERGGVTQVVENHVEALSDHVDQILLLSGPRTSGLREETRRRVECVIVDEMEYDSVRGSRADATQLAERLRNVLTDRNLAPHQCVLHWHNHSLGKNVSQPQVIQTLDKLGFYQVLQIHDFAEDYRPDNLRKLIEASGATNTTELTSYCYPSSPQIHYATLSRFDARILEALGIAGETVHVVPNSVTLGNELPDADEARQTLLSAAGLPPDAKWCLYPVRGIRRKNLGEFCLLTRWLPEDMFSGITLPPATEIERHSYERWRATAQEVAPRAIFDAGTFEQVTFQQNLAAAQFVLSTSAAEGFGMAFLEPWLARRGVIARRLPAVVSDFESAGLQLDAFYDTVRVPADGAWCVAASEETSAAFELAWRSVPSWCRPKRTSPAVAPQEIDFGLLTPNRQIEVLRRAQSDAGFEAALRDLNRTIVQSLATPLPADVIEQNRQVISGHYAIEHASGRLRTIYAMLLDQTAVVPQHTHRGASSVDLVCAGRDFFPCRTESEIK